MRNFLALSYGVHLKKPKAYLYFWHCGLLFFIFSKKNNICRNVNRMALRGKNNNEIFLKAGILISLLMSFHQAKASEAAAFLSCDLIFPQAVQVNPNTVFVPFQLTGRLITVTARVDTMEGAFFLDTGAERLLLNKNYFELNKGDRRVAAAGATGRVGTAYYRRVDSLHWDALFFLNQQANILDLSHIERKKNIRLIGIIGFEVCRILKYSSTTGKS